MVGRVRGPRSNWVLLVLIAASTPLALAVETGIRHLILPPEFEQVRLWLRPRVTPWAWAMVPATVVATLFGLKLQRWLYRREHSRLLTRLDPAAAHDKAVFESLMLSTSAPQLPALAATIGFMLGSALLPVLVAIAVATAGVLVLGVFVLRSGAPQRSA